MAKKKIKDLIEVALGLDNKETSTEDELAVLAESSNKEETETFTLKTLDLDGQPVLYSRPTEEIPNYSYNAEYNPSTKKYDLVTVIYTSNAFEVKREFLGDTLAEVNYKLGKLIIEKLIKTGKK